MEPEPTKHGKRANVKVLSFAGYRHVDEQTMPERIANALDWAAQHFPKQWAAYNELLRGVMGYKKKPSLRSREIEALRSRMSRVRSILATKYGRGLVTEPGVGCRATSNDEDILKTDMVAQASRLASASRSYARTASLIDITKVSQTKDNEPWLKWFKQDVRGRLAQIQSPDYLKKLLPPKDDEE
jgi:hypothetical protein